MPIRLDWFPPACKYKVLLCCTFSEYCDIIYINSSFIFCCFASFTSKQCNTSIQTITNSNNVVIQTSAYQKELCIKSCSCVLPDSTVTGQADWQDNWIQHCLTCSGLNNLSGNFYGSLIFVFVSLMFSLCSELDSSPQSHLDLQNHKYQELYTITNNTQQVESNQISTWPNR